MLTSSSTVYRGRLRGETVIGGAIKVAVCESLGLQHDAPGVRLRGFTFVGEPRTEEGPPDLIYDLVVRSPSWLPRG